MDPTPLGLIPAAQALARIIECDSPGRRVQFDADGDIVGWEDEGLAEFRTERAPGNRKAYSDPISHPFDAAHAGAVAQLERALLSGELHVEIHEPATGRAFRLTPQELKAASALTRDSIWSSGAIFALYDEPLGRYRGRTPFVREADFNEWLAAWRKAEGMRATSGAEHKCQKWLEALMLEAPNEPTHTKSELLPEAKKCGVSERGFDRIWTKAAQNVAPAWSSKGARKGKLRKLRRKR